MKDKRETRDRLHRPGTADPRPDVSKTRALEGSFQRRGVTDEQLRKLKAEGLRRDIVAGEVRAIDEEKRTVELAFSSEAEVERWFGIEVLDHSEGAMRTERLEDGAAVLVNHDWDDQVGVVESVTVGADRRGRAVVRFGKGTRASEVWQDVVDGIRRHVSVGYSIHKVEVEERAGQADMVRVTDWEPHEISIVSVPADVSVGVGRSQEPPPAEPGQGGPDTASNGQSGSAGESTTYRSSEMNEKILRDKKGNLVRAKVDGDGNILEVLEMIERAGEEQDKARRAGVQAEQQRVKAIMDMGREYENTELATRFVSDGKSPEEFQRALLADMHKQRSKAITDHGGGEGETRSASIGMTDTDLRRYSMMNVVRALANPQDKRAQEAASFELELSQEAERQYGKQARGILIPDDVLSRAFNAGGAANTPTGATSGENLVDSQFMAGSFIEMLRNRTALMRLATTMSGLVGNVEIPKQTGGATAYWLGEGDDASEETPTIGQIALSPKTVAAYTDITRRLMLQSTPDAERVVRNDLAAAVAQAIDAAGFYGAGGNEPTGIANVNGINAVNLTTTGKPTYAEAVQMESEISADNADVNSMAYVMASAMRGHFKTTQKFDGTNGAPIWEPGNTVNGYGTEVTNQIQAGDLFFGNFADLIIGMWGGLDLTVDPYSLSKSGGTRLVVFQDVDMAIRRVESFCLGRNTGA
ncbi:MULTISPECIES: phage major capsid protein [unclassified Halomonas]|uniref:phage major capsid protein n=1 Tax=unclassified Halomonas TaxID=2609666 RepID=UPI00288630A4|nr:MULTISPECIES: phage major capsid protein [unclassified Halomonas]MDT0499703.1 phage major capsid protein [Halomonas sp. PAR7]MDT0510480.1 phage major capsid protein [Halomonas sp. LES1]MDT0589811.1 phage major capsid protein [Halomonas sp. PAR8]